MAEKTDHGPRSLRGVTFYDIAHIDVGAFCPDSEDGSTPATQVHMMIHLASPLDPKPHPLVMRFHGPRTLDALIETLIQYRSYVFGRRKWRGDYPEQDGGSNG